MNLLTPASANEKQLTALKIYSRSPALCSDIRTDARGTDGTVAEAHVQYASVLLSLRSSCAYIPLCGVFACVSAQVIFCMWHLIFTSCGLALLFAGSLPHLIPVSALGLSPFKGFFSAPPPPPPADPKDLCRFRLTVGPSPQPCCGSLTQHGMCYSSHVVMSCQKQP